VRPLTVDDILAALRRLIPGVRKTPLVRSTALSAMCGSTVWLKAENLQHTGSFKVRGASNWIGAMTNSERADGVIAASAGNHAQGVAVAARAYAASATIVMPLTTPLAKVQATRDYGANVILHGDSYDGACAHACELAGERGLALIPAYDDPLIIAGQGTVAVEIFEDARDVDVLLVPVGGGGLAGGVGLAARAYWPHAAVIGVQVEAAPGVKRSLERGAPVSSPPRPTIAEGVAVSGPGDVTFPLLQRVLDDVIIVGEDDVAQAMVLLLERSKLVVEGAGALGVAALMAGKINVRGKTTVAVLSGGNVDINMIARVVEHGLMQAGRYYNLTVGLDDKPGQLALLSELISRTGANVLVVDHHRFGIALPVGRVQVALLLEVRDRTHAAEVDGALMAHGFRLRDGEPRFVPEGWTLEQG
jgi:threonine dehydratase